MCAAHEFEIVWISSFSLCALSWIERNIRIFITEFISHEYVRNANAAGSRPRLSLCHFFCPTGKGGNSPFKYFSKILKVWLFTLATRKSWHWSSESIWKETKALHFRKRYFSMHFFMKSKSRLKWQNINIQKLCQGYFYTQSCNPHNLHKTRSLPTIVWRAHQQSNSHKYRKIKH